MSKRSSGDIASELIAVLESRLEAFEELEPDARMVAEWALTVALEGTDVKAAARRYLEGGPRIGGAEGSEVMGIACISDRVLCPLDGRCPACTIARLRERERFLERDNNRLRHEVEALGWGLDQIYRHVLRNDGDLGVAGFASAVSKTRDANPAHLELLGALKGAK